MVRCKRIVVYVVLILSIVMSSFHSLCATNGDINVSNLSYDLQEAYKLGIGENQLFKYPDQEMTQKKGVQLIEKTLQKMYGASNLKVLKELKSASQNPKLKKYDLLEILYLAEVERLYGYQKINELKADFTNPIMNTRASFTAKRIDGTFGETGVWDSCKDYAKLEGPNLRGVILDYRAAYAVDFFLKHYDLRTGEKIITYNSNACVEPDKILTNKEVLEILKRYYYSKLPTPQFITPKEVGKHTINQSLYAGSTSLPNASNEHLPKWKGMLLCHQAWTLDGAIGCDADDVVMEHDIKALSDCGFNFARIAISFSRLQGGNTLKGAVYPQNGTLNVRELEYLDKIISWGMKYGVHIQIVMFEVPGVNGNTSIPDVWVKNDSIYADKKLQQDVAQICGALSKRYADIPNNYLSFNLINEPSPPDDKSYVEGYLPTIKAIRAECPDRVIVADIHSHNITGEEMAKQGIALSYHLYDPREFCVPNMYEYAKNPKIFDKYDWPFKDSTGMIWNGENCLNKSQLPITPLQLKQIADKHQVGFMIGEWGCFYDGEPGRLYEYAYEKGVKEKMFTDMIKTFDQYDIGWSYGNYIGGLGIVTTYPIPNAGYTYQKIDHSPHYIIKENYFAFNEILESTASELN